MREIIYNSDNLLDDDITDVVVRTKALIINNNNIYLGKENDIYQFPGGHLEKNETLLECLKREIREETGIIINDSEVEKPFLKIVYMNKDYPEINKNGMSEIYYYVVNTNKLVNLDEVNYTEEEKKNNFKIEIIPVDKVISIIKDNIFKNEKNKIISRDMIIAIDEYLKNIIDNN